MYYTVQVLAMYMFQLCNRYVCKFQLCNIVIGMYASFSYLIGMYAIGVVLAMYKWCYPMSVQYSDAV